MRLAPNKRPPISVAAIMLICCLISLSCSDLNEDNFVNANQAGNSNVRNTLPVKDNSMELATIINLPILPSEKDEERADWREDTIAQKGKKLIAILKYDEENTAKLTSLVEKHKPGTPVEIGVEEWYPEELIAQTQLSGNESIKGLSYEAKDFFNPPYDKGRLIRITESNFFVLELTTY